MELFNKGERNIGTAIMQKADDGSEYPVHIAPQESIDVPEDEAAKLLELYPDELIETKNIPVNTSEVDALKAENEELKTKIEKLESADVADLQSQIVELQTIVDANADKDATIESLKAEIAKLKTKPVLTPKTK